MAHINLNQFSLFRAGLYLLKNTVCANVVKTPFRTTFILKRKFEIPLRRKNVERRIRLKRRHFIYEFVADTNVKRYDDIEVVLTEFVEDLGKRGQLVKVRPQYAYNYLILPGRAVYATPENIAKEKILSEQDVEKHSTVTAYKTQKMLTKKVLSIYMNMKVPWTIEPWHIRVAFRNEGLHILSEDSIEMPPKPINGPDLNLEGKDFAVIITINNLEKIPVRCRLRHWSALFTEKITLPPDHDIVPSDAIIPEQEELLKSIPLPVKPEA